MKAVRLYSPGDMRVEEVAIPTPNAEEVLLKVIACGVCGSDIPRANIYGAHNLPLTLGHEFSAEIVELGEQVEGFDVGDRVTVAPLIPCYQCKWCASGHFSLCESYSYFGSRREGAMAEYVASPTKNLLKLPENVGYTDAATTDPCANAMHALLLANPKKGDVLCVFGSGPIGLYAIACSRQFGIEKVIAIDIDDRKLEVAKQYGADHVINSVKIDPVEEVKAITSGYYADLVIDFTGAPQAQLQGFDCVSKLGKFVVVGISHKGLPLEAYQVDKLMRGQVCIMGSWNSFSAPFPGTEWTTSLELFEKGLISSDAMITQKLALDDAPNIFKKISEGKLFFNKIMFYPHGVVR